MFATNRDGPPAEPRHGRGACLCATGVTRALEEARPRGAAEQPCGQAASAASRVDIADGPAKLPRTFWRFTLARVTVEDCLERVNNRFALVILAAERARQLANGGRPLVACHNKPAVTSLREIAKGEVRFNESVESTVRQYLDEVKARGNRPEGSRRA